MNPIDGVLLLGQGTQPRCSCEPVNLHDLVIDESIHPMAEVRPGLVKQYRDSLRRNRSMRPIDVFRDGDYTILADGFHRVRAARERGYEGLTARVFPGNRRDALLHALNASAPRDSREDRRTDADRRKAVDLLLSDPECSAWSDLRVGDFLRIGPKLVERARAGEPEPPQKPEPARPSSVARGLGPPSAHPNAIVDDPVLKPRRSKRAGSMPMAALAADPETDVEYLGRCLVRARLGGDQLQRFDRAALLFRRIRYLEAYEQFRIATAKVLGPRKTDPVRDKVGRDLDRFFNAPLPLDWKLCLDCEGEGQVAGRECRVCQGNGFV